MSSASAGVRQGPELGRTSSASLLCPEQVVNPHLLKDLTERGLWNEEMKNQIIARNGSIQVPVGNREKGAGTANGPGGGSVCSVWVTRPGEGKL